MAENGFVIYGKVTGKESKRSFSGLTVEALDKDLLADDRLGSVKTDKDGNFKIVYDKKDFKELFFDNKPDIYLQVKNANGEIIYTTKDKIKFKGGQSEELDLSIPEKLLEQPEIEWQRWQFKQLVTINPNYFGSFGKKLGEIDFPIVFPYSQKTKYEQLTCVGLYPEDNLLEAVIEVKLPSGYSGSLCSTGSKEYVAFYVDYNDGLGFVSVGAAAEVNVHDFSFVNGGHLFYAVRRPFTPKKLQKCDEPQIVQVRAILSWESLPTGPAFIPTWGNAMDAFVQIKPKESGAVVFPLPSFEIEPILKFDPIQISELGPKLPEPPFPPVEKFAVSGEKAEIKALIDKSLEAEARIKESGQVEPERFDFKAMMIKNPNYFGSISDKQDKDSILDAISKMPQTSIESLLPKLSIDPGWLVPVKPMLYNTNYEQLKCVGLYPENDLLEAVIEVKKPYGYNGSLCTLGSKEYVAFYIDWGAGYQHVATSGVSVHDIPEAGDKKLYYAVKGKISDITSKLKACTIDNIVKVKAILSWNIDPTPFGPYYTPAWGNALEKYIQIRPLDGASVKCNIEIVNEVHTDDISQSGFNEGLAIKINSSGSAVPFVFDRPFGGVIGCWGNVNIPYAAYYRFRFSDDNGLSWNNITDPRIARNPSIFIPTTVRTPDSQGWFSVSDYNTDVVNYSLTALVHWKTAGKDGDYLLKLEVARADKSLLCADEVALKLDNTGIEFFEFGGTPTPLPAEGVVVKDSSDNYKKCGIFTGSETIKVYGNFRDDYFRNFSLIVFGGNLPVSGTGIGSGRYDNGILDRNNNPVPAWAGHINAHGILLAADGSLGQQIGALNLCDIPQSPQKVRCAYGVRLSVWDRAIVGSVHGYEYDTHAHGRSAFVTYDWDPAGC